MLQYSKSGVSARPMRFEFLREVCGWKSGRIRRGVLVWGTAFHGSPHRASLAARGGSGGGVLAPQPSKAATTQRQSGGDHNCD